jgi:MerR family transcriptional regulator, copper efflux regulator
MTDGTPPSREVLAVLDAHLREIDRRLADLGELRSGLSTAFDAARSAVHQGNEVRLCRILDTRDDHAATAADSTRRERSC